MNDNTSLQMKQIVSRIRHQAEEAQNAFDLDSQMLQLKSSQTIDLFGGTATSQVADIAADARYICDKLYVTLQTLVRMANEECRPLLEHQPSLAAVGAVRDLIRWLNQESGIRTNFSASVNSSSLGNIASGRYIPTMESKMLQSYWEVKYDTWASWVLASTTQPVRPTATVPTTAQATAAAAAQAPTQALRKETLSLTEEELAYREAFRRREEAIANAKQLCDEETNKRVGQLRAQLEAKAKAQYEEEVATQTGIQAAQMQHIADAQAAIRKLGIFRMKAVIAQQEIINNADQAYRNASAALQEAETEYGQALTRASQEAESKRSSIHREVLAALQTPQMPKKPASVIAAQQTNRSIQQAIFAYMEPDVLYCLADLQRDIPVAMDLSPARLSALLRQMVPDSLERTEKDGKSFFRALK